MSCNFIDKIELTNSEWLRVALRESSVVFKKSLVCHSIITWIISTDLALRINKKSSRDE